MIRRAGMLTSLVVVTAIALAGCSPAPETAWRDLVSQAAEQASAGDYAAADATLSAVEQDVAAARDGERIDAARAEQILAAAAVVRADLTTFSTPAPAPTPAPSETAPPASTTPPSANPEDDGDEEDDTSTTDPGDDKGKPGPKENNGKGPADKDDDE